MMHLEISRCKINNFKRGMDNESVNI